MKARDEVGRSHQKLRAGVRKTLGLELSEYIWGKGPLGLTGTEDVMGAGLAGVCNTDSALTPGAGLRLDLHLCC